MRILLILLLTPALLYGGAIGYLWFKVQESAEKLVQSAAPFASITYDSIHVSPLGNEIGLNKITISPSMTADQFSIERVRINVPHIGYFLDTSDYINKQTLPEHMGLQLERMHIDIDSELFTMIEQMQQQAMQAQGNPFATMVSGLDALGCGEVDMFEISDYRNMGLGVIVANADINIRFDEKQSRSHINTNISADNLYQMDMTFEFAHKPGDLAMTAKGIPETTIQYRDNGYHKLRNKYCSDLNSSSVEAYVDEHIHLMGKTLNATFPESSTSAYREFMLKGGNIMIKLAPEDEFALNGIEYYKASDIIDMLGLAVQINGTSMDTNGIQWGSAANSPETRAGATAKKPEPSPYLAPPPDDDTTAQAVQKKSQPTYHEVDISDAGKYLNRMAEITTREGKVRRGLLESVDEDRITLIIKISAGSMSYPAEKHTLNRLRVLY